MEYFISSWGVWEVGRNLLSLNPLPGKAFSDFLARGGVLLHWTGTGPVVPLLPLVKGIEWLRVTISRPVGVSHCFSSSLGKGLSKKASVNFLV